MDGRSNRLMDMAEPYLTDLRELADQWIQANPGAARRVPAFLLGRRAYRDGAIVRLADPCGAGVQGACAGSRSTPERRAGDSTSILSQRTDQAELCALPRCDRSRRRRRGPSSVRPALGLTGPTLSHTIARQRTPGRPSAAICTCRRRRGIRRRCRRRRRQRPTDLCGQAKRVDVGAEPVG